MKYITIALFGVLLVLVTSDMAGILDTTVWAAWGGLWLVGLCSIPQIFFISVWMTSGLV